MLLQKSSDVRDGRRERRRERPSRRAARGLRWNSDLCITYVSAETPASQLLYPRVWSVRTYCYLVLPANTSHLYSFSAVDVRLVVISLRSSKTACAGELRPPNLPNGLTSRASASGEPTEVGFVPSPSPPPWLP